MTTPNPNTPAPAPEGGDDIAKLREALRKEREEHKATKTALSVFRADIGKATGLGEDAPLEAIAARLTDTDKLIQEKTTAIQTERDEAVKRAETLLSERKAEKLEAAIDAGLRRSGVKPECLEDARTILRGALEVNEKGEVVTKTAPNVIPGQSVEFFTVSQLRQMRPHYWPTSVGGGARGASGRADIAGDISCFDPKHANYNLTAQGAYLRTHGREAFDRARARFGGGKW